MKNGKKVVAVLSDLMFQVKIQEAAKQAGFEVAFVKSKDDAVAQAKKEPALIIVDLNNREGDPLETISQLKSLDETRDLYLLGFVSHVQADLIRAAKERGCDLVIARSAFSRDLPALLQKHQAGSS